MKNILPHQHSHSRRHLGQRIVDSLAKFFGSWYFIIVLLVVVAFWLIINTVILVEEKVFDPEPFSTLSFYLACLAAIQVPIILMSQNRQSKRMAAKEEHDFEVNRKAEAKIEEIQVKLDQVLEQLKKR